MPTTATAEAAGRRLCAGCRRLWRRSLRDARAACRPCPRAAAASPFSRRAVPIWRHLCPKGKDDTVNMEQLHVDILSYARPSPAEDVEFLVERLDLLVPGDDVQLERVPDVGPFLDVLDVAVDVRQRRGRRQQQ